MVTPVLARDPRTGLPTVAATIESARRSIQERGALVILYFNFDRFAKLEEIYGWERLDAVLNTTARALRDGLNATEYSKAQLAVSFANDDDFVLFHIPGDERHVESEFAALVEQLQTMTCDRLESVHGPDIASLFALYVGHAHVHFDSKVRLERLIYRGIREAAANSRSVEQRAHARTVADLRETLRTRALYIDYHPIVIAGDEKIFGYEALARGTLRSLRRPEVMFEAAAEAGLIWELSRLCRERAVEGMKELLHNGELLFLNVDPHDFADPAFDEREMGVANPRQVVIEITERTAIKDYPHFRERLRRFRDLGYRFAVDDAGSGYAGLGSIANLEPDFIKLDISLINGIDSNFIKQDLVGTLVRFANDQNAMVIAEGVERAEEYEAVKALGVHLVQGFLLHPPESFGRGDEPVTASV